MAKLTIRTLGGIWLTLDGREVQDTMSNKSLALICLLLTCEGFAMRKTRMTALLWENSDDEASKNNLRFNLWSVKKIIPPDDDGHEFIGADKSNVFLNPAYDFTADIVELSAFNEAAEYSVETLLSLKSLFRGEYLEGFYLKDCAEHSEIILMERIACQNRHTVVLERLHALHHKQGEHAQCIRVLSDALAIDPYNEHYACLMMQAMAASGRATGAVAYYRNFENNLRVHLNVSPSAELRALFETLAARGRAEASPPAEAPEITDNALEVRAGCVPGIAYYWAAECLRLLLAALPSIVLMAHEDTRATLGLLCPALSQAKAPDIPPALLPLRLAQAFHGFLEDVSATHRLVLAAVGSAEMDPASRALVQVLEQRPLPGVQISLE